jgi:hypothetical protein
MSEVSELDKMNDMNEMKFHSQDNNRQISPEGATGNGG